jgi:hypothetical protein
VRGEDVDCFGMNDDLKGVSGKEVVVIREYQQERRVTVQKSTIHPKNGIPRV